MITKTKIHVRFSQSGTHFWANASERRSYLRATHYHTFNVTVECEVKHQDREIEFHDLIDVSKQYLKKLGIQNDLVNFGSRSCESLANELANKLKDFYSRPFTVTVDEDGLCGATVVQEN